MSVKGAGLEVLMSWVPVLLWPPVAVQSFYDRLELKAT